MKIQKITKSAKGEKCTLNSPVCNYDCDTTVFCHLNEQFAGKGIGIKADDHAGFYGCSDCHDLYDRRKFMSAERQEAWQQDEYFYLLRAVIRTYKRLFETKVIK